MTAGRRDFTIEQGATWAQAVRWLQADRVTPVADMTGWAAAFTAWTHRRDQPVVELTTANGGAAIDPATGEVSWALPDEDTTALSFANAEYVLEVTDPANGGTTHRLLEGQLALDRR